MSSGERVGGRSRLGRSETLIFLRSVLLSHHISHLPDEFKPVPYLVLVDLDLHVQNQTPVKHQ